MEERLLHIRISAWMELCKRNSVKPTTYDRLETSLKLLQQYSIAFMDILNLRQEDLQNFINEMVEDGYSQSTIRKQFHLISAYLKYALNRGDVSRPIYSDINLPAPTAVKKPRREVQSYTRAQQMMLKKELRTYARTGYAAAILMMETGMRIGEIFGLRWKDIDFSAKVLAVRNSVVMVNSGAIFQESGKTSNAIRRIQFSEELRNALAEHAAWQHMVIHQLPNIWHKSDFVVNHKNGSFCDPGYFSERVFKRLLKAARITTDVRFHDLRHTHATLLLADGVNPKVVSERLGHSNIRITLDTYAHVLPTMQEEAVKSIEKILGK